jgi:hypothetical protein
MTHIPTRNANPFAAIERRNALAGESSAASLALFDFGLLITVTTRFVSLSAFPQLLLLHRTGIPKADIVDEHDHDIGRAIRGLHLESSGGLASRASSVVMLTVSRLARQSGVKLLDSVVATGEDQ